MRYELLLRVLTATALITSTLAVLLSDNALLLLAVSLTVAVLAAWELTQCWIIGLWRWIYLLILAAVLWGHVWSTVIIDGLVHAMPVVIGLWSWVWIVLVPIAMHRFIHQRRMRGLVGFEALLGWAILDAFVMAVFLLRQWDPWALLMVLSWVWAADSGAYFAGKIWGHRLLAPALSPKKTWEGLAGGVCMAVVVMTLWYLCYTPLQHGWSWLGWCAFAAWVAVLSALGDLAQSLWKRLRGIKDSGRLLPGHGGILDRIDGLLPVLPFVAIVWSFYAPF